MVVEMKAGLFSLPQAVRSEGKLEIQKIKKSLQDECAQVVVS